MTHAAPLPENLKQLEELEGKVSREEIPAALGELERIRVKLWLRLQAPQAKKGADESDRLVDVREAAKILGISPGSLYRKADEYPFFRRVGRLLRFSYRGIQKYLKESVDG